MALPWDFHPLEGDGFRLDLLQPGDLDDLYALQSDPEVCRYLLYEPRSYEKVTEVLARDGAATRLDEKDSYIQPAIRTPDGRLVGTMYLNIASVEDSTAEMGWLLSPPVRGRGYATRAARLLLGLCFGELGLHRVYAELDPRNTASSDICRRLGMRHEAHFREHMWLKGEWTDTAVYGILEHEFRGTAASPTVAASPSH